MFRSIAMGVAMTGLAAGTALAASPTVTTSFADLTSRGYKVAAEVTMPDPTPPQLDLLITLQNGTSVAVCYMSAYGWLAMSDDNLLRPDGCKVRDLTGGAAAAVPSK
jgi:hypothetical protein